MNQLVIIGAGGFGREVRAWARQASPAWTVRGFVDDDPGALARFEGIESVLGGVATYRPESDDRFVCALGRIEFKRRCVERVRAAGGVFTSLRHDSAVVGDRVRLGSGVILCPHATVGSDARLGDFVTVNLHSSVAHDAVVGSWTQLHCHVDVTGGVVIGEGVTIGSHASILPGVRVGDGAVIGSGAVVMRDVAPGETVFGAPARPYIRGVEVHA